MKKHNKGITLIALVITIIVLLILAGISIAMLTGENGILTKAGESKKETQRADTIERAKLEILEYEAENEGKITDAKAYEMIAKYDKNYKENEVFQFETNEKDEEYLVTKEGHEILVKEIWNTASSQKIHFTLEGVEYTCSANAVWGDDEIKEILKGKGYGNYNEKVIKVGEYGDASQGTWFWVISQGDKDVKVGDSVIDKTIYTIGREDLGMWNWENW